MPHEYSIFYNPSARVDTAMTHTTLVPLPIRKQKSRTYQRCFPTFTNWSSTRSGRRVSLATTVALSFEDPIVDLQSKYEPSPGPVEPVCQLNRPKIYMLLMEGDGTLHDTATLFLKLFEGLPLAGSDNYNERYSLIS